MNGSELRSLLRKALTMPPHRVAAKVMARLQHRADVARERNADVTKGTFAGRSGHWHGSLKLAVLDIGADQQERLRQMGDAAIAHRFDLLGSGPVELRYGVSCAGFLGHAFPAGQPVTPDVGGDWLKQRINASNLMQSQRIWTLGENPSYRPIDWQLDFRSGYRWRSDTHISGLPIPVDTGADVKVPWELGRLQHLPVLASCAALAAAGATGFLAANCYRDEIRSQLLDFISLNPPRFGVQWMCPMDVAIRGANIVLALDCLAGVGVLLDDAAADVVVASLRDHACHVRTHLEWSETRRNNHYLSNLAGLVWMASALPPDAESAEMLTFAADEFLAEAPRHFTKDGGNIEGSTGYHRLSGEIVLFGLARLASTGCDVPEALLALLSNAARFSAAATHSDGGVVQIGDTDSGRFLRFDEDPLDHHGFVDGVATLGGEASGSMEATIVRALVGRSFAVPDANEIADHGDLDAAIATVSAWPSSRHRALRGSVPGTAWQRAAFPQFGLYIFRASADMVAFRCEPKPSDHAPRGHRHDDNLAIDYSVGSERRLDPGTYCYTPSSAERERYRAAEAHDVVRANEWDVARPDGMFDIHHAAWARCIAWRPDGVAGEIVNGSRRLMRVLKFSDEGVDIWDGVAPPDTLRPVSALLPVAVGYGRLES